MPKPTAERVAAHRARKREAGLVKVEFWVTPDEKTKLRELYQRLVKDREA